MANKEIKILKGEKANLFYKALFELNQFWKKTYSDGKYPFLNGKLLFIKDIKDNNFISHIVGKPLYNNKKMSPLKDMDDCSLVIDGKALFEFDKLLKLNKLKIDKIIITDKKITLKNENHNFVHEINYNKKDKVLIDVRIFNNSMMLKSTKISKPISKVILPEEKLEKYIKGYDSFKLKFLNKDKKLITNVIANQRFLPNVTKTSEVTFYLYNVYYEDKKVLGHYIVKGNIITNNFSFNTYTFIAKLKK